jgi:hypothetical protein
VRLDHLLSKVYKQEMNPLRLVHILYLLFREQYEHLENCTERKKKTKESKAESKRSWALLEITEKKRSSYKEHRADA